MARITPTNTERHFATEDIIVSKTDLRGKITYANRVFLSIAGYTEDEVLGQPHSLIRHPDMPRAVFKLLWDTLEQGKEVFAYVKNMCKNGDHYWVFAHVTPTRDASGRVIGYHSNRRVPEQRSLDAIKPLYDQLLAIERQHTDRSQGLAASYAHLQGVLKQKQIAYEEFIFSI